MDPRARGKAFELAGFRQTIPVDRGELNDHATAPGIVERMRDLLISTLQKSIHVQVALMMALRRVSTTALYVVKDTLAEAIESDLSQFAKHFPI